MSDDTRSKDNTDIETWESEMSSISQNVSRILFTVCITLRNGEIHL